MFGQHIKAALCDWQTGSLSLSIVLATSRPPVAMRLLGSEQH